MSIVPRNLRPVIFGVDPFSTQKVPNSQKRGEFFNLLAGDM